MKVIRTTENLPNLFDITKYKDMDKLNPFEWLCLLRHRQFVYSNACYLAEKDKYSEDDLIFMLECDPKEEIGNILKAPFEIYDSFNTVKYMRDWDNDDLNKAHDIFEKYDKKIEVKEEDINWVKFEKELEEQFSISYQEVKLIILAFYKNRQWSEVCYQYAKENSCIELNGIVLEYERNFK